MTDDEIPLAGAAAEKALAALVLGAGHDEVVAVLLHGFEALGIALFESHDLRRRQALRLDIGVARRVPVEAIMQEGIEAEVILGPDPAEFGDARELPHVRPQGHGLEAD